MPEKMSLGGRAPAPVPIPVPGVELSSVQPLTVDSLVAHLSDQFSINQPFTAIGYNLISLNPYGQLSIFGKEYVQNYISRKENAERTDPHIFQIASQALQNIQTGQQDQCVILLGRALFVYFFQIENIFTR